MCWWQLLARSLVPALVERVRRRAVLFLGAHARSGGRGLGAEHRVLACSLTFFFHLFVEAE